MGIIVSEWIKVIVCCIWSTRILELIFFVRSFVMRCCYEYCSSFDLINILLSMSVCGICMSPLNCISLLFFLFCVRVCVCVFTLGSRVLGRSRSAVRNEDWSFYRALAAARASARYQNGSARSAQKTSHKTSSPRQ